MTVYIYIYTELYTDLYTYRYICMYTWSYDVGSTALRGRLIPGRLTWRRRAAVFATQWRQQLGMISESGFLRFLLVWGWPVFIYPYISSYYLYYHIIYIIILSIYLFIYISIYLSIYVHIIYIYTQLYRIYGWIDMYMYIYICMYNSTEYMDGWMDR